MTHRINDRIFESFTDLYEPDTYCLNCGCTVGFHYFKDRRGREDLQGDCQRCQDDNKLCEQFLPNTQEVLAIIMDMQLQPYKEVMDDYLNQYIEGIL